MLSSLDRLGAVGTQVITASKDNTVADLKALQPTLAQLTKSGDDLPNSLRLLLSFPFPDDATQGAIKGDYANLHATLDLNVAELLKQNAAGLKAERSVRPAVRCRRCRASRRCPACPGCASRSCRAVPAAVQVPGSASLPRSPDTRRRC